MRKEIHWELCKRRKFDHSVHKSETVLENETYKILEMQTDHPFPVLISRNEWIYHQLNFDLPENNRVKFNEG